MTRKEAIEILRNLLKELTEDFDALTEEEHEAYNMAISSLEIDGMNDMSRKEAIELLDNLIGMIEDNHGADYDTALHMAINSLKVDEAYQLEVDAVSRKAVINQIFYSTDNNGDVVLGSALRERIARLPSVTPIR